MFFRAGILPLPMEMRPSTAIKPVRRPFRCYGSVPGTTSLSARLSGGRSSTTFAAESAAAHSLLPGAATIETCKWRAGAADRTFADFLLGIPDTSAIAYGNADKYFRQSVSDAFIADDWRVGPQLTVSAGVRWEYGAPITELYGRLVNLDVTPGFAAAAPVLASIRGAADRARLSNFVDPPRSHDVAPRLGIAWRPISGSFAWSSARATASITTRRSIRRSRSKWRNRRRFRKA